MKNSLFVSIITLFTLGAILTACTKNETLDHLDVNAVKSLYGPDNNKFVKLQPSTDAATEFEWEQARAEDGGLVIYEIAFDKVGGDFSKPVYKLSSDNNGLLNKATLTHKLLNKIANMAGIKALETGKLQWTVFSSKGINAKKAEESRLVELERPAGFAEIPTEVYLTGAATEAGEDGTKAIKLKQNSEGVFEIFTSLKPGTYKFVNRVSGTPTSYSIDNKILKEGGTTTETKSRIVKIVLDFNNTASTTITIQNLVLYFAPFDKVLGELKYAGNGRFTGTDIPVVFKQESWGRDERYKFKMAIINEDGAAAVKYYNSANRDNNRATSASPASYYFLMDNGDASQWDYTFKFATEVDNKNIDVTVDFSPAASNYTHKITIK